VSPFLCPHCRQALAEKGRALVCPKVHSFDLAAEGYVNLTVGKSGAGDSPAMCRGRHEFLTVGGYYRPFAEDIAREVAKHGAKAVCDAGCGEGFYLRTLREALPDAELVGLDLAKTSIKLAARAEKGRANPIAYAVAGIFEMPLPDGAFDAVLSVFAPVPEAEAHRILKKDGILLVAHPGKDHLMGMKRLLYENPYENEEKDFAFVGFEKIYDLRSAYTVEVEREQLQNLFLMTPYFWKTSREDADKLSTVPALATELDFILSVYRRV
jgi:23S rRNA (guanine745-N1)-methyltransferase